MAWHFFEHFAAFLEQPFAAEQGDHDGVDVLVGLAPDLALHVLEESEGALPIAALRELLEHRSEVVLGQLVLEHVQAPRDAATRREAAELVD